MKKIILIAISFTTICFTSCKKDRTCTCSDATGSEVRKYTKVTKSQAEADCQTVTHTEAGVSSTENCTLK